MNKGGIAIRLINFAKVLTGRVPGSWPIPMQWLICCSEPFQAPVWRRHLPWDHNRPGGKEEGYDDNFAAAVNVATAPTGLLRPATC